ncbi:MAG: hypothetical protein FJX74_06760 [Armatimonadetes bacterium]|nr:hypothetical protein [Armatimonadota bacterium]
MLALLVVTGLCAAEEQILLEQEQSVARGDAALVEFPAVPTPGMTALLEVRARMDSPGLGGSMLFMELALNGKSVEAAKTRMVCRLTNRPLVSPVAPNLPSAWYGVGGWRVLYSPDFEAAKAQAFYEGDPYSLVLDVTDLLAAEGPNTLTVTNTASAAMAQRVNAPLDLVIGGLRLRTEAGLSPTLTAADRHDHVINRGEPGAGPAEYRGELLGGGGFAITAGGRRYLFRTELSYPDAGFHRLAASPAPAEDLNWAPTVTASADGGAVAARCPQYGLARRVRFLPRRIEITDRITNLDAGSGLGLLARHAVELKGHTGAAVRIAGNADPAVNQYYCPPNPSVYLAEGDLGLGLIGEDDVFRNQATLFFDPAEVTAGLRTDMLYLGPGESHELRWSVYPVGSRDYYDFINLVREDWGANYTVEGAWCFFGPDQILDMPAEELKASLERLGVRYACSWGGWVDPRADGHRIGFGAEVLSDYWADYRARLKAATEKLHAAKPDVRVLVYYDSQRDTYADSGQVYPDSRLTNAAGVHDSTEWGGQYSLTWSMFATLQSSFGKAMLTVADAYMDEIGADGLYWDEMENVAFGYPLLTYAQPDGRSCLLDPATYTVKQQVGVTTLLGAEHRAGVVERVRAKGGFVMGNGPTAVRRLLDLHVQRMVEIQHNDVWCYEGNLDSPLGYGSGELGFSNVVRGLGMATLLVGTRLDYPFDFSRYTFPFTPVELHHGYLLGKERIITMHSGAYAWPGETAKALVHLFAADGALRATEGPVSVSPEARATVELAEGEVAVIERVAQ